MGSGNEVVSGMKAYGKQRNGRGFSLTEMLVAVGILAVLLAVAVPSIFYYRRELKLTELDDNARAVFMAAQNHLSALRSTSVGDLEVSAAVGREAQDVPGAAVPGLGAETKLKYVATDIEKADPDWLVLPRSIEGDIAAGSYLVEFDPASGAVYGVFFMEKGEGNALDGSVYSNIGTTCRVRDGRRSFAKDNGLFVGYYGADGALDITRPETKKLPTPKLTLVNAEELRLDISADSVSGTIQKSKLRVDVTATDGAHTKALVNGENFQVGDVGRVVLDTLKYDANKQGYSGGWIVGKSFQDWMGDVITPGADITLTVSIWYQPDAGEGIAALPTSASVKTNSLFASRNGDTVKVAYGRHLENLGAAGLDSTITAAEQIKTIDFAADGAGDGVYYWAKTYDAEFPFVPIQNSHLSSFDGGNLAIKNLYAVKDSGRYENAGLFDSFTGSVLKNVVMEDAQVKGKTAGSLAGSVMSATVDNCRAYILEESGAGRYSAAVRVDGTTYAGGLIGQCVDSTIGNGSFAATVVSGTGSVGGLVGLGGNLKVNQCYAAGHLSGRNVGGMVGAGNAKLENCYAAGTIFRASSMAAGLVTSPNQVVRSYAAVDYVTVPAPAADGTAKVYGAVPTGSICTNVYYLVKPGVNSAGGGVAVSSSQQMKKSAGLAGLGSAFAEGEDEDVPAYPYQLPNKPEGGERDPKLYAPYPYPTLKVGEEAVEHYGDWLLNEGSAFLAYYEKYADGSYGYYYFDPQKPETAAYNTLRGDSDGNYGAVVEEGYGVLSSNEPSLTDATNGAVTLSENTAATLTIEEKTYTLFTLDGAWLQSHHGYQAVTVSGQKVYFNPDFAKTVSLTEKNTATDYAVRSVRQLDNIDALGDYASKSFTQELEIDGATFAGTLYGKNVGDWKTFPVQYVDRPFTGTFVGGMDKGGKGKSAKIMHLDIKNSGSAGLFGTIGTGATVRDVAMASVSVTAEGGDAGSLAAVISGGTVSNCGAWVVTDAGETKDAPYDSYTVQASTGGAGGFAGKITGGTVDKCFAAVKVTAKTSGGFVSSLSGGTVSNSYAAGHTVEGVFEDPVDGKSANITGSSVAGGFVGDWTAGDITGICYVTISVDGGSSGTVGSFAAQYPSGKAPLSDCYARSYVYRSGTLVSPDDVTDLGLDTSMYKGDKGTAHPYDESLSEEYDFKPIPGLEHYGDWSLKKLRGLVAYYEQIETDSGLKTEFDYYARNEDVTQPPLKKGNLDKTRTDAVYSDGYAFLSLSQLHKDGEEAKPVIIQVAIGEEDTLVNQPTTYLGGYDENCEPFVDDPGNPYDKPTYYAYALPNSAFGVPGKDDYYMRLRVKGEDSDAENDSLWFNPHFGRTAYNGYGNTNPGGTVGVPLGGKDLPIAVRSVRQLNNIRKYFDVWTGFTQELDIDGSCYKGDVVTDAEGYLTVAGMRVTVPQADGTWAPTKATTLPKTYRLNFTALYMVESDGVTASAMNGCYDGGAHTISGLTIGAYNHVKDKKDYSGLFYRVNKGGVLKNVCLKDCDVTGTSGDNFCVGALVGRTDGTITNCTVKNCTVTMKQGSKNGGHVGGLAGYVTGGTIQNCGVHLEGNNLDSRYKSCCVTGTNNAGGFVGCLKSGTIQYCYAAVKVSGKVAGGFAGSFGSGTLSNCYAGGHTEGGVYPPSAPNVTGTNNAGGFIGVWSSGTMGGLCYTTCSVTAGSGTADVFAVGGIKTVPEGCYAGGDVIVEGVAGKQSDHNSMNVAIRTLAMEPEDNQVVAYRYDRALPEKYFHKPITYADGTAMPHYGDWYSTFEWTREPEKFTDVPRPDMTQHEAVWSGDTLSLTITTVGMGTSLPDQFQAGGGHFTITTDLGYVMVFLAKKNNDSEGSIAIYADSGEKICDVYPTITGDGYTSPYTQTYVFDLPIKNLPPYKETINVGGYKEGYIISGIENEDPDACTVKPTEPFMLGDKVTIDGDFSDWTSYPHQLLTHTQGDGKAGSAVGAAYGDGNTIYVHIRNNFVKNLVDANYSGTLSNLPPFNFEMKVQGYSSWAWDTVKWGNLLGQTYNGPGIYELVYEELDYSTWPPTVKSTSHQAKAYVTVGPDGSQEIEMSIDLNETVGVEAANKITRVEFLYGMLGGQLTIWRDPKE